jgi:UDP-2,4-diacetamido-2,4,6-trideoxy-beta-L-altropyranose hydrolase
MRRPVVAVRTDCGARTGFGHLRRCLSLGQALQRLGAHVQFFVSRDPDTSAAPGALHGFTVVEVDPRDADDLDETTRGMRAIGAQALVVDSYNVRPEALTGIEVPRGAIVDHIPHSPLPVELLVNSSIDAVECSVSAFPSTVLLLGPAYVLLRAEFEQAAQRVIRDKITRVLVTTGGSDTSDLSLTFVGWIRQVMGQVAIDAIVGPYFAPGTIAALERAAEADPRLALHRDPHDLRAIMLGADVAVTGGGQTTYELAATGTPAIAVSVADNQRSNLRGLLARGALVWVGDAGAADLRERSMQSLKELSGNPGARQEMSRAALTVVDGKGAARVAAEMLKLC